MSGSLRGKSHLKRETTCFNLL